MSVGRLGVMCRTVIETEKNSAFRSISMWMSDEAMSKRFFSFYSRVFTSYLILRMGIAVSAARFKAPP